MRLPLLPAVVALATAAAPQAVRADDPAVAVRTDFPGGNVVVVKNAGAAVELAPDLRGGRDWFYWCFEAAAARPGEVVFTFPAKVAGFANGAIGHQGPAVSTDGGKTWNWMGNDTAVVRGRSFSYAFTKAGEAVRFAVTLPYLQADWEAFVARQTGNPHLEVGPRPGDGSEGPGRADPGGGAGEPDGQAGLPAARVGPRDAGAVRRRVVLALPRARGIRHGVCRSGPVGASWGTVSGRGSWP